MRLRSPSGKVITNKFIQSKLQKRSEKLNYSSSISNPLIFSDFVWMNSHLINLNIFLRFITLHRSAIGRVIKQLVQSLKKIQHDEFFVENARLKIFRATGIKLSDSDLSGAWFRCINVDKLYVKLIFTCQIALSVENFEDLKLDSKTLELKNLARSKLFIKTNGVGSLSSITLLDMMFCFIEYINHHEDSKPTTSVLFSNDEIDICFLRNCNLDVMSNNKISNKLFLEFKYGTSLALQALDLTLEDKCLKIDLNLVASLYASFPDDNQLLLSQGFMQNLLINSALVLNYEQRRIVFLLVHILALNVLVKRKS